MSILENNFKHWAALLRAPPAEVLDDVLREQFGPLPQLAAICRLKRLPSGGYSSTEDLQLVLERRRVANAKERERIKKSQPWFCQTEDAGAISSPKQEA
ncbi:factor in the germline alpha-like [Eubalaena glacialis]|uniref:factor in the germline alpha-like n=1 Tax=Eubalaena glacialis TaxID=27606 RepID=UPI002A5A1A8A|nr:factor in the germline alpha-like [Eubalaena glacialis]